MNNTVVGKAASKNPYYIVSPNYTRESAGIRALHLLCHYLNINGERAYLLIYPYRNSTPSSPDLYTPLLTQEIVNNDCSD